MKKVLSVLTCLMLVISLLSGCEKENNKKDGEESSVTPEEVEIIATDNDMFTNRDNETEYDEESAVRIECNGTSISASDSSVNVSNQTITITDSGTYVICGTLSDGMIIVDASETDKLQIVLNEVDITSKTSAPLYIKEADKVFVTLVGENTLSNGGEFIQIDDNNIDGVVFSKQDLTFNGEGVLNVSSPSGHGIVGKDDLIFVGGSYNITSASHGIQANDSVRIKNANITVDSGKDGIQVENSDNAEKGFLYINGGILKIESEGDGLSASSYIQISEGEFEIVAGGGYKNGNKDHSDNFGQFGGGGMQPGGVGPGGRAVSSTTDDSLTSMKGIKSDNSILISNGSFTIDSADDAIHSNISLTIDDGDFLISSGDDAIHAEETLTFKNGNVNITNCYEGLEALHINVLGGDIKLKATDDGLNAAGGKDNSGAGGRDEMFGGGRPGGGMSQNSNGSIVISGGTLYINASGDGIDANGTLEITGGHTTVVGPTQGDTAVLDYDVSGTISGGTFIGTGAYNMAQTFSSSKQGVIAVYVGNQPAGTKILLKDSNGKEIVSYEPELAFQIVILSTPEMKSGETYSIVVGTQSGEFKAN